VKPHPESDFLDEVIAERTKANSGFMAMVDRAKTLKVQKKLGRPPISWRDIAAAISVYEAEGFEYIETPWVTSEWAVKSTLPSDRKGLSCDGGMLVGSAEQGFIELMSKGGIAPGRYVSAGPCFRDDVQDDLHQQTFFKVELIELSKERFPNPKAKVREMAEIAKSFYQMLDGGDLLEIVTTKEGLDLTLHGIELGSYGKRSMNGWHWIYGTGLAEPRLSVVNSGRF
jgi:hypothetical protein